MRLRYAAPAAGLLALAAIAAHAQPTFNPVETRTRIDALIRDSGADVAVAFRALDGRDELLIEPESSFTPRAR